MMKRWLASLSALALVTFLVGCGASVDSGSGSAGNNDSAANSSTSSETNSADTGDALEDELIVGIHPELVDLMESVIIKKFKEEYPEVALTYATYNASEALSIIKAGKGKNPQLDLTIMSSDAHENGRKEGLWMTLDKKDIPNWEKVVRVQNSVKENTGIPIYYGAHVITYNKDIVESKGLPIPKSWNDLARPELKRYLALAGLNSVYGRSTLVNLAYANGGSEHNIDPGFKKLEEIAANQETFFAGESQLNQEMQEGRAAFTVWNSSAHFRYSKVANYTFEYVIPEEGVYFSASIANIPNGSKHPNAAKKFIDLMLSDEVQKLLAEELNFIPVVDVELSPETKEKLDPIINAKERMPDVSVTTSHLSEWVERFDKEIVPKLGTNLK